MCNSTNLPLHTVLRSLLQNRTIATRSAPRLFAWLSIFIDSNLSDVCTNDFDTQVYQCNRLKNLRGHAAERIPIQNPITSLLKEQVVCAVPSALTRNVLFEICSTVDIRLLYISKGIKHRETDF
jgi:hypothetical protein